MFTLQSDYAVTLKIFLPRLYAWCVDAADIEDINLGRKKYKLNYLGPSSVVAYYKPGIVVPVQTRKYTIIMDGLICNVVFSFIL